MNPVFTKCDWPVWAYFYNPKFKIDFMDSGHTRVIPRDLFNEAKLLKCIGRLTLLIHDGFAINNMEFEHDGDPFDIRLCDAGNLYIDNIQFKIGEQPLYFHTTYNSKSNWPLYLEYDYVEYLVFDESGEYTEEFKEFCSQLIEV